MKWDNLAKNKCPQCSKDIMTGIKVDQVKGTMRHPCGFSISAIKYRQITMNMNVQRLPKNRYENI